MHLKLPRRRKATDETSLIICVCGQQQAEIAIQASWQCMAVVATVAMVREPLGPPSDGAAG